MLNRMAYVGLFSCQTLIERGGAVDIAQKQIHSSVKYGHCEI